MRGNNSVYLRTKEAWEIFPVSAQLETLLETTMEHLVHRGTYRPMAANVEVLLAEQKEVTSNLRNQLSGAKTRRSNPRHDPG